MKKKEIAMPQDYYERQEARRERLETRAEKMRQEAQYLCNKAADMSAIIPFGQPIHVGHYSEKRDRNYRARIENIYCKSFECGKKADYYSEKAGVVGTGGISSDAPDAVELLEAKLAELEVKQTRMKAENKAAGRGKPKPFEPWELTNNNANIHRVKTRIKQLKATAQHVTTKTPFDGGTIIDNVEENRLQIVFNDKPDEDTRVKLKGHGFRWSPRNSAWQRMRSNAATCYAKRICGLTA